jgi:diguanylate cyclase (GGDEF)-like protein
VSETEQPPRPEERALLRLLTMSAAPYEQQMAVPAEYALELLSASSVTLSRWERGEGVLRAIVTAGRLAPGEQRFPTDEMFDLSEYGDLLDLSGGPGITFERADPHLSAVGRQLLDRRGHSGAISVPVMVDDRVWGVLWATKDEGPLHLGALARAARGAASIGPMITLAERLQTMSRLAFEDPLTGLGNRRRLDDSLAALLAPGAGGCTIVVCDVNGLKIVNDEQGHDAGDAIIVAVADALAAAVSGVPGSVAVRMGGDEFTLVLPGSARTPAITAVETAAAQLDSGSISISCGIAAVPAGTHARTALALADSAQYAAKRRGALLVASSDGHEPPPPPPRHRADRRALRSASVASQPQAAVVGEAVRAVAHAMGERPGSPRGRLEWLGEQLLERFGLDHWSVSVADLARDPAPLVVGALGIRANRSPGQLPGDLMTDHVFRLGDYPMTHEAVTTCAWFTVDVADPDADPGERAVLTQMSERWVLAVGFSAGDTGSLLELYGSTEGADLDLLGSALGVLASAVLERVVSPVGESSARMGA